jgi:hypothetical protein
MAFDHLVVLVGLVGLVAWPYGLFVVQMSPDPHGKLGAHFVGLVARGNGDLLGKCCARNVA